MANEDEKDAGTGSVTVVPLKRYEDAVEGYVTPASKPFKMDRRRFAELKANGLVDDADKVKAARDNPEEQTAKRLTQPDDPEAAKMAADSPYNKMARAPANKTATSEEPLKAPAKPSRS